MDQRTTKSGKVVFKEYEQHQSTLLPPSLDELIPAKHLVRIVNQLIDRIALLLLENAYQGGASNYHPKMMLKVLIYAYCTKVYSCRQIAAALEKDIHFEGVAKHKKVFISEL